jgi:hypothetical protein
MARSVIRDSESMPAGRNVALSVASLPCAISFSSELRALLEVLQAVLRVVAADALDDIADAAQAVGHDEVDRLDLESGRSGSAR